MVSIPADPQQALAGELQECRQLLGRLEDNRRTLHDIAQQMDLAMRSVEAFTSNGHRGSSVRHSPYGSMQVAGAQVAALNNRRELLNQHQRQYSQLEVQLRTEYVNKLQHCIETFKLAAQSAIGQMLPTWQLEKKRAQIGAPQPNENTVVATLQSLCGCLSELSQKHMQVQEDLRAVGVTIAPFNAMQCYKWLLQKSFVTFDEPPMLVKQRFTCGVRLFALQCLAESVAPFPQVNCVVLSEKDAAEIFNEKNSTEQIYDLCHKIQKIGTVTTKGKEDLVSISGTVGADFKQIKVQVNNRRKDRDAPSNVPKVICQRYCLVFLGQIVAGNEQIKLAARSLPFVVSVHFNQDRVLLGEIFYAMTFSSHNMALPLQPREQIRWPEFAQALSYLFSLQLGIKHRHLNASHRTYLGQVFFHDNTLTEAQLEQKMVIKQAIFSSEGRKFSFWEWFFGIINMLQEKSGKVGALKELWEEQEDNGKRYYLMEGFIQKEDAAKKLRLQSEPMMIIRFSEGVLSAVSVAYKVPAPGSPKIDQLKPFSLRENLRRFPLPFWILNCEQLRNVRFIYPDTPVECLSKYAQLDEEYDEYVANHYTRFYMRFGAPGKQVASSTAPASPASSLGRPPSSLGRPPSTSSFVSSGPKSPMLYPNSIAQQEGSSETTPFPLPPLDLVLQDQEPLLRWVLQEYGGDKNFDFTDLEDIIYSSDQDDISNTPL